MGRFDDLDLSAVPSLSPLPDGVYIVRITGQKVKPTQTGNEKIAWESDVEEPADAAKKVPKFYFDSPLVETALWRLKNMAKAAGVLKEGKGGFDPEDMVGKRIGLVIVFEITKDYGPRSNITAYLRADVATPVVRGDWKAVEEGVEASEQAASEPTPAPTFT